MKSELEVIAAAMQANLDSYQVRDEGMVSFKTSLQAINQLITVADTQAAPVIQTVVNDSKLDQILTTLENVETLVVKSLESTASKEPVLLSLQTGNNLITPGSVPVLVPVPSTPQVL